jgi:hypothetical protein
MVSTCFPVVFSFFISSLLTSAFIQLYLPVQWNKSPLGHGVEAGQLRPHLRRYVPSTARGRHTGLGLRPTDPSAAAAAKALASPTSFTSPSTEAYPYSAFADYEDVAERRMMMSQHSEQHRTLIDLLRERGTIGQHERLPEDAIFEDEDAAEAYRLRDYTSNVARQGQSTDTTEYGEAYQPGARRGVDDVDEAFANALGEPLYLQAQLPAGVEPVYGARGAIERGPVNSDILPLVVSGAIQPFSRIMSLQSCPAAAKLRLASRCVCLHALCHGILADHSIDDFTAGFSRLSVPPKNVVISVSRDVEIDREDGVSRA